MNIPALHFTEGGWCEALKTSYVPGPYQPRTIEEFKALAPFAQKPVPVLEEVPPEPTGDADPVESDIEPDTETPGDEPKESEIVEDVPPAPVSYADLRKELKALGGVFKVGMTADSLKAEIARLKQSAADSATL